MKMSLNKALRTTGTAVGALMFTALIPAAATLIISLITRERGSDTVPFITLVFDIVFASAAAALQAADLAMMALFLTVGRIRGLIFRSAFLFGGMLTNMLFAGLCMLIYDRADGLPVLYCLSTGLMFLVSALTLSVSEDERVKKEP